MAHRLYRIQRASTIVLALLWLLGIGALAPSLSFAEETEGELDLEPQSVTASDYSYEVTPLLSPFNTYLYVKTDNPDPTSFRVVDDDPSSASATGSACYEVETTTFLDVAYEDLATHRVHGGYLFVGSYSDGGTLTVYASEEKGYLHEEICTVELPTLMDRYDYLVETCATAGSFFEDLDAVQSALSNLAVYPRGTYDTSSPADALYPYYTVSPYPELSLNQHVPAPYEAHPKGGMLVSAAYPYVLDSSSFPRTMEVVARTLDRTCTVGEGDVHWMTSITHDGVTRQYGGTGEGGSRPVLDTNIDQIYRFDGSEGDYGTTATLQRMRSTYLAYSMRGIEEARERGNPLTGDAFKAAIGAGSWISVLVEGPLPLPTSYAYMTTQPDGTLLPVGDAWVDGRYLDNHEEWKQGVTFDEHPTADILVRGVAYTAQDGSSGTSDLLYRYDANGDRWVLPNSYLTGRTYETGVATELTKAQVETMHLDANTNTELGSWLICNGSALPGTRSDEYVPHSKIKIGFKSKTLSPDTMAVIPLTFTPADPAHAELAWTSTDPSVATVETRSSQSSSGETEYTYFINAYAVGTATITCTSADGITASAKVEVVAGAPTPEDAVTLKIIGNRIIDVGETLRLAANISPVYAMPKAIWYSYEPEVATVDENGLVTAISEGVARIQCWAGDYRAYDTVVVHVGRHFTKLELEASTSVCVDGYLHLSLDAVPDTRDGLRWSSSNTSIAAVDEDGCVYGIKRGTATITVTAPNDNLSSSCKITVTGSSQYVDAPWSATMFVGQTKRFPATVYPSSASQSVRWWSQDDDIATVNTRTNVVTARKPGTATLTCSSTDGRTSRMTLTVVEATMSAVTMSKSSPYTGKALAPKVTIGSTTLARGTDYSIAYKDATGKSIAASEVKLPGTYKATITGMGALTGSKTQTFTITKGAQKLKAKAAKKTVKAAQVKRKAKKLRTLTVSGAQGKLAYKKASGAKQLTVNKKTGVVTVRKGTKKGTYIIKVKVSAAATACYQAATKTVTVKVVVR